MLGSSEVQFGGLNLDDEAEADHADTGNERIDDYCDRHRLDVRSRIELFIQVCKAVHVAHQHAIIHGNLMPDFILITSSGVPKLLHFGKANSAAFGSFANDPNDGAAASLTPLGEPVLTPEYTAPEQVTGETVTTASDVYALGVILYRLMTGRRPYHFKTRNVQEVLQAICEQAPEAPSASVVRPLDCRAIPFAQLPGTTVPQSESTTELPQNSPVSSAVLKCRMNSLPHADVLPSG